MFERRQKPHHHERILNFFWPSIGWRRSVRYLLYRLSRLPGTPYSIASGFACGAAISFTPFVGFHFILGAIWAWIMRANILASAIGTAVGNPWTFPFIWVWIFQSGHWMGFGSENIDVAGMDFSALFGKMTEASLNGDIHQFIDYASPVLLPMLIGSIPSMIVVWIIFYFPLKKLLERYQLRRLKIRAKRQSRIAAKKGH